MFECSRAQTRTSSPTTFGPSASFDRRRSPEKRGSPQNGSELFACPELLTVAVKEYPHHQQQTLKHEVLLTGKGAQRVSSGTGDCTTVPGLDEGVVEPLCMVDTPEDVPSDYSPPHLSSGESCRAGLEMCDGEPSLSKENASPVKHTRHTIDQTEVPVGEYPWQAAARQPNDLQGQARQASGSSQFKEAPGLDSSSADLRTSATNERSPPKDKPAVQNSQPPDEVKRRVRVEPGKEWETCLDRKLGHTKDSFIIEMGQDGVVSGQRPHAADSSERGSGDHPQMSSQVSLVEGRKKRARRRASGEQTETMDDWDGQRDWYSTVVWYRTVVACLTAAS